MHTWYSRDAFQYVISLAVREDSEVLTETSKSRYMATELIPQGNDRILCVKVGKVPRENLYEMTRKYWVVKLSRASTATHVLAIINSIVVAVYIPQSWKMTEDKDHEGRCEFVGKEDLNSDYIGKSVKEHYGKCRGPVRYINM